MTTCLLCTSEAVADGLCVEDGARLWAAQWWTVDARKAANMVDKAKHYESYIGPVYVMSGDTLALLERRWSALRELDDATKATAFLARLDAARASKGSP